jgi:hypothetical protein
MRWNRFEVAPADIRNLFVEMQQLHLDMGVAFDTCVAAPLLHITGFAEGWPTLPFQTPHAATSRCSGRLNEQGEKSEQNKGDTLRTSTLDQPPPFLASRFFR